MKFEYIGSDGCKDLDLVIFKVLDKDDVLVKGKIIDVPDQLTDLIRRLKVNGNYRIVKSVRANNRGKKRKRR